MFAKIPYFKNESQQDLQLVNQIIQQQVKSDIVLINQVGHYIINSGGKRLRPIITILSGKSLGYQQNELYQQAAMVEFIHTSTLLHDDVVDESDLRRGRKTANNIFGNAASVLVGDFLYTRAFQLMVSPNNMRIMQVMADATNIIAAGEVMQLINIGNININKDEYLQVIQSKTAKLFEAAAQVGAILAGASTEQEMALKQYGMYMGIGFQIIDDILDYSGNTEITGKNVGDDLTEGKVTLPLIYLLQQGSEAAKKAVSHALQHADKTHFEEIHQYILNSSALDYCYTEAQKITTQAVDRLKSLQSNQYIQTLAELALTSLNRIK